MLKECLLLDINNFLHDVSPYVTNRPLPPYHAAATTSGQGAPSTSVLPVQLVEIEIFHDSHETRLSRYPDINRDEPYIGTSFGQGGRGFNQFGSMGRAIFGSDFFNNPGLSALHGTEPISLSQGYKSQQRGDAGTPKSSRVANHTRL